MRQRGVVILLVLAVALVLLFSLVPVLADNHTTATATGASSQANSDANVKTDATTSASASDPSKSAPTTVDANAQLEVGAGITPDSNFYFIEKGLLEKFRSDVENREKKIAEIREMVQAGKYEQARIALVRYKEFADKLEREVSPEDKEEAQRSANAIRNAIKEIESQIPAAQKKEFVDDIKAQEGRIERAADVAAKIKELCQTLATLDPEQYARTCKTNKEAPQWQQDLDEKLTDEQKKEAEAFFKTMSACFQDPKNCKCEDIKIEKFANSCKEIAPLAAKCQDGDEDSCSKMEDIEDPIESLPPHLASVMERLNSKYSDDKFDNFAPPECKKAGAKTREACMKIMLRKHAPPEVIEAIESGELKVDYTNERTMRESIERFMFNKYAPKECIDAGLKDHKKCGELMCEQNLPDECKAAGLGCGNGRPDKIMRECEQLMRSKNENSGSNQGPGRGFAFGKHCNNIEGKEERLQCFEDVFSSVQQGGFPGRGPEEHFGNFDGQGPPGGFGQGSGQGFDYRSKPNAGFPEECRKAGIDGKNADDGERCSKLMRERGQERHQDTQRYQEDFARQCSERGGRWDCSFAGSGGNPCRCEYPENREYKQSPEGFRPPEGQYPRPPEGGLQQPPPSTTQPPSSDSAKSGTSTDTSTGTSTGTTTGTSTGTSSGTTTGSTGSTDASTSTSTSTGSGSTSTGTSISTGTSTSTTTGNTGSTSSGESGSSSSSTSTSTTTTTTGGVITGNAVARSDNSFIKYYFNEYRKG